MVVKIKKNHKKVCDKKKLKSYNYKNPLETPQLES